MSWPRPVAASGRASVRWGTMVDYSYPSTIAWDLEETDMPYHGSPLTADRRLLSASPILNNKRAMAAQWRLVAGSRTYYSPVSALRY